MYEQNGQLYCKQGHPYLKENTHFTKHGYRKCRACDKVFQKNRRISNPQKIKKWRREYYLRYSEKILQKMREKYPQQKEIYLKRAHKSSLKVQYGLSPEDYLELLRLQDFKCSICKMELHPPMHKRGYKTPHIDHCHKSKKFRGILCANCNWGLGHFKDSVSRLRAAIEYLEASADATDSHENNP